MKKTMKLALLVCLALLACVLMFVACDSGNENQTPSGTTDGTTEPGTDAHVHSFDEWTTVKEPTCTEKGEQERVCACGAKEKQSIDMVAHSFGEWITTKDATCTEKGEQERACSCGEKETKSIDIIAHTFGEWSTIKEATCTSDGKMQKNCSACGNTIEESIPQQHTIYEHRCTMCDYEDEYLAKFDVSNHEDGSIYAYVYKTDIENQYELCFYGKGRIKDFYAPYASLFPKIKHVVFGEGITYIGNYAFRSSGNLYLHTLQFSSTIQVIGEGAFENVSLNSALQLPNALQVIDTCAFKSFSAKYDFILPSSVTYVGDFAFQGACFNSFTMSSNIERIGERAFSQLYEDSFISREKNQFENGYYVGSEDNPYFMLVGVTNKEITTLNIHPNTEIIAEFAVSECIFLKEISIPNNIRYIGDAAFFLTPGLLYNELDNLLYLGNTDNPYLVLMGTRDKSITTAKIHEKTAIIYEGALGNCSKITSVIFPDDLKHIGRWAFASCSDLNNIVIPSSVILIGNEAFCNCSNLTTITISDGVKQIDYGAFSSCSKLSNIDLPCTITRISYNIFNGTNLSSVIIPTSIKYIEGYAFPEATLYITYNGTQEQWKQISIEYKDRNRYYWDNYYTIICTDGTVTK